MDNYKLLDQVLAKNTEKPFVIAEVGQAHEGSLGQAISFIEAIAETGAGRESMWSEDKVFAYNACMNTKSI